jgi:ubiquinone/menaquinone biosynthesis C-methylase UbiE
MLDLTGVTLASRVLDIGAGTGHQTLMAAGRVGPQGMVLATDISATMLALTLEAAREAGLAHVEAVARLSLQFVPDLGRALAQVRRCRRPGGDLRRRCSRRSQHESLADALRNVEESQPPFVRLMAKGRMASSLRAKRSWRSEPPDACAPRTSARGK